MAKFSPGDTIAGQYEVLSLLGEGGMSTVYRCDDLVLKRIVAVKVLHIDVADAPQALRRLQLEGQAIARFQHKYIIQPYGAAVTLDGLPYLVTEVVNGQSLSTLLKGGQFKWARCLNLISQICEALAHAHEHGVVHRDLKPSNIMVENVGKPNESIKLLDFGIAKLTSDTTSSATQPGALFGTPAYMSPEQAEGMSGDARSDQYATACLLYEMVCGEPPFHSEGGATLQMLMQHRYAQVPSISQRSADTLPDHVETAYQRMMQKDPDKRFPDMVEAKNALIGIKKRKVERAAVVVGGVALIIVCGGVWFALQKPQVDKPAEPKKQINFIDPMNSLVNNHDQEVAKLYEKHPDATVLQLGSQIFTIQGVAQISHFDHLKTLSLWHAGGIDNAALKQFKDLPLESLDVSKTDITDDGMKYIGEMKNLRTLIMSSVNVHDEGLKHIEGLHSLEVLNITRLPVTDKSIPILNKLPIKELHIGFVYAFKNHMGELNLPRLEALSIRGIPFTDEGIQILAKFPKLTDLTLTESQISKEGLLRLVKHFKHLKRLDVSHSVLEPKDVPEITRALPPGCKVQLERERDGRTDHDADKDGLLKSLTKFGMEDVAP